MGCLAPRPGGHDPAPPLAVGFGEFGKCFGSSPTRSGWNFSGLFRLHVFMDAQVGRVLVELDRRKLWDDTVVVFVGDHGYHLGEHKWWNKNTLFERSCRAPLIIGGPGMKLGLAEGLVEFVDLFPTIADFCGLQPPPACGSSRRSWLEKPSHPGKTRLSQWSPAARVNTCDSIRTDRWRYTKWSDGSRELYDHEADSEETVNLAASRKYEAVVRQLFRTDDSAQFVPQVLTASRNESRTITSSKTQNICCDGARPLPQISGPASAQVQRFCSGQTEPRWLE